MPTTMAPSRGSFLIDLRERERAERAETDFDEEVSVLPRHTKVIVRGNNWTRTVGLDGWHWLVLLLTNGVEVKLQRNALSVLKPPTGLEEDGNDSEDGRSNIGQYIKTFRNLTNFA